MSLGPGVGTGSFGLGVCIVFSLLTEMRRDARLFRRLGFNADGSETRQKKGARICSGLRKVRL